MRRSKIDSVIALLLELYFIYIFFYGVVIKVTFSNRVLFSLKTYIPEALLTLVCVCAALKKNRINKSAFFMMVVYLSVFGLNLLTSFSSNSFMMTVRDVLIPIVVGFMLATIKLDKQSAESFFRKMTFFCYIALLAGMIIGVMQYSHDWQWTSSWYTGYPFWGEDARSSMYIMTTGSHVRVPSITGHNVKFAMYSFFQFLFIACFYGYKTKIRNQFIPITSLIMMLINVFLSNNKTTLVIIFLIFAFYLMNKFKSRSRVIVCVAFIVLGMYVYYEASTSSDFLLSFYERFSKWSVLKDPAMLRNIILPISTYNFAGNSATEIPVLNYWDNTYFYFLFSFGAIGVIALINWLKKLYSAIQNSKKDRNVKMFITFITVFAALAACTTSIVLGRCFFNVYIIAMTYFYALEEDFD